MTPKKEVKFDQDMPEKKPKAIQKAAEERKYVDPYTANLLSQGFIKDPETGAWVKKNEQEV